MLSKEPWAERLGSDQRCGAWMIYTLIWFEVMLNQGEDMFRKIAVLAASSLAVFMLFGCASDGSGQMQGDAEEPEQSAQATVNGSIASPTPTAPSFPEEAFRSGQATEFVGYNVFDQIEPAIGMDPHGVAFVNKEGRFYAPVHLYELSDGFEDDRWCYDNVPMGSQVRTTADYVNDAGQYTSTYEYDTSFGDECLVLDRSAGDELYVTSETALSDIQVFNAYCILPVSDGGMFGGTFSGTIDEVQRVSRDDANAFEAALASLQLEIHDGRIDGYEAVRSFLTGEVPETVTIRTSSSQETTVELDRYYTVTPEYHNPTDSGVQVGIKEQADTYAVLDLSNVNPGRYLVPSYGEDYMLIEVW